jgi:membrane protease YdiL (CAAX protease family)
MPIASRIPAGDPAGQRQSIQAAPPDAPKMKRVGSEPAIWNSHAPMATMASDQGDPKGVVAPLAAAGDYWSQSRGPLASLALVTPLLLLYELGVLCLGADAARNGADVWLRGWLDRLGFSHYFLLPSLATALLLGWHHASGARWRLDPRVLGGMCLDCGRLAGCLLAVAQAQGAALDSMTGAAPAAAVRAGGMELCGRLVAFAGAGIYEELLFRLMLLPAAIALARALGIGGAASVVCGIVATSVVFSLAHYVGAGGDVWRWHTFAFRAAAGGCFAVLFVRRGFGIAAGAHAGYDILAGLL